MVGQVGQVGVIAENCKLKVGMVKKRIFGINDSGHRIGDTIREGSSLTDMVS